MDLEQMLWTEGVLQMLEGSYCGLHAIEIFGLGNTSMRVHEILTLPLVLKLTEQLNRLYVSCPLEGSDVKLARDGTGFDTSYGSSQQPLPELFALGDHWRNSDFFLSNSDEEVQLAETQEIRIEASSSTVLAFRNEEGFIVASMDRDCVITVVNKWLKDFSPDPDLLEAAGCDLGWRCLAWKDEMVPPSPLGASSFPHIEQTK